MSQKPIQKARRSQTLHCYWSVFDTKEIIHYEFFSLHIENTCFKFGIFFYTSAFVENDNIFISRCLLCYVTV